MKYDDLEREQKVALANLVVALRPVGVRFIEAAHEAKAILAGHAASSAEALGLLDDDEAVPNDGGVFGAADLTKAEILSVLSDLQSVADLFGTDDKFDSFVKTSGVTPILEA